MTQVQSEIGEVLARAKFAHDAAREERMETCPEHGAYDSWECPGCAAKREAEKKMDMRRAFLGSYSGIPKRFLGLGFSGMEAPTDNADRNISALRFYAQNFPDHAGLGRSLVLCGGTGTGKTRLACAAAEEIILTHGSKCRYTTAYHIVRDIKATYGKNDQDEREALMGFISPALLIIDEVGVQFGTDTEKLLLFEVVNGRYEEVKPTIIVSNLEREKIADYLGDRVMDRLKENGGGTLVFDWPSYRK